MVRVNIEIKTISNDQNKIREILKSKNAEFKGIDHKIDTRLYSLIFKTGSYLT